MRRPYFQSAMDNGEFGDKLTKQQAQQPDNQRDQNPANEEKALEQKQLELESPHNTVHPDHIPGLEYQPVPVDRPCLFTVLAFCLNQSVEFLRTEVATHIEDNMEVYRDSINPNKTPEQYLVDLRNGLEWANNLEIMALMRIFEQPIIVIGPDGRIGNELDRPDLLGLLCFCDPIFVQYNDQNYFGAFILDGTKEAKEIINDLIQSSDLSLDISTPPLDLEPINKEEACEGKKIDPPPHLDQEPLNTEIKGDALNIKKSDIQFCIGTIQKFKFDLVIVIRRAEALLRSIQNELLNDSQVFNIVKCFIDHSVNERHPAAKAYFNILRLIRNVRTKNGVVSDEAALITLAKWLNLLNDANDLDEEIFKQIITYRNPNEIFVDLSSAIKELQAEQQAQQEEAIKLETNAQLPRREPMLRRIKEPEPDQEQTQQSAHQIKQEPAKKEPTNPHKNDDGSWRSFPTEDADRVQYSIDTIAKQILKKGEYLRFFGGGSNESNYRTLLSDWKFLLYTLSSDATEIRYLWTASILLEIDPMYIFCEENEHSISSKVVRMVKKSPFDQSDQIKHNHSCIQFTKSSLFETKFKHHLTEGWLLKKQREIAQTIWNERKLSYSYCKEQLKEKIKLYLKQSKKNDLNGLIVRDESSPHPYADHAYLFRLGQFIGVDCLISSRNTYRTLRVHPPFSSSRRGLIDALAWVEQMYEYQGLFPSIEEIHAIRYDLTPEEQSEKMNADKERAIKFKTEELNRLFFNEDNDPPTTSGISWWLKGEGADINLQNHHGKTALILSVDGQHDRIAEYLLKLGADPLIRNKNGELASDLASKNSAIYTLLKEKEKELEGAKLPAAERYGQLLLEHIVTLDANARQIEEYLDLGADVDYQDPKGFSALMLAVDKQNERLAEFLLKCNADPMLKNNRGKTARDLASSNTGIYAILKGYEFIFATVAATLQTVAVDLTTLRSLLVGDKALIDFRSHQGHTALLIAVESGPYALVEFLIAQDADLSIPRADGQGVFDLVEDDEIHQLLSLAKRSREAEENASPRTSQSNPSNNMFSFFEGTDGIPEDEESIVDETLQDDRTYSGPND